GGETAAEEDPDRARRDALRDRVPEELPRVEVVHHQEDDAEDEGDHRAPPERIERPRDELRVHDLLRGRIDRALEGDVHEIEEIEVPDPDDAGEDVGPPENQIEVWMDLREFFHRWRPPLDALLPSHRGI